MTSTGQRSGGKQILAATHWLAPAAFGLAFGFLLQKGGVAKYEVLIGQLLLQDFTVLRVMLTAIVAGTLGVFALHRLGKVDLHVKPTRYAANTVGGLLFGVGFALAGYCPGTGAAALGQGNYDATAVIAGMMAGSYVFALVSNWSATTLEKWGERGSITFPELLHIKQLPPAIAMAGVLLVALAVIHRML